jgi:hypothetical protein
MRASPTGLHMADQFTARKLWCLDQAMRDRRVTDLDFRILYYISHSTDRETGEARRKQTMIADAVGAERRSVQRCIERLETLGHLQISFAPGRSKVNGYRLCLEKATLPSPLNNGTDAEPIFGYREKATLESHTELGKGDRRVQKRRPYSTEKATRHSHQSLPCLIPCTLPPRARASLLKRSARLARRCRHDLGPDLARSWFGKAVITDFVRDTLTIEMPTRFSAHRVKSDYEHAVRACCSALVPAIKSIRIVVAARAGAAA